MVCGKIEIYIVRYRLIYGKSITDWRDDLFFHAVIPTDSAWRL